MVASAETKELYPKPNNRKQTVWRFIYSTDPPQTVKTAAKLFGRSERSLRRDLKVVIDWMAHTSQDERVTAQNALEVTDPEKFADVMEYATNPLYSSLTEVGVETGVPYETLLAFMKRFKNRYPDLKIALETHSSTHIENMLNSMIGHVMTSVSYEDIANASLRDKIAAVGILIEKRQLLRGEPTEILSSTQRATFGDLADGILQEMNRRGLIPEFNVMEGDYRVVDGKSDEPPVP